MIAHLPEMIQAGITSFKIEGRMREAEFITTLINQYATVLDRYIADPLGYSSEDAETWIYENRKRDLSTAYAFGNPGATNINTRYEGTGKFYSTGRMFSTPTKEQAHQIEATERIKTIFAQNADPSKHTTATTVSSVDISAPQRTYGISVKVDDLVQAKAALQEGVDRIYLSLEVFEPKKKFTLEAVKDFMKSRGTTEIFLAMPRMMDDLQMENLKAWVRQLPDLDGLLVTHLGAIHPFRDSKLKLVGDFSLNVFNHEAAAFYKSEGLHEITPSIELNAQQLSQFLKKVDDVELVAFGRLSTMYMSHDLIKTHSVQEGHDLILKNEAGDYLVKRDVFGKCHLISQLRLNLRPVMENLSVSSIRIEGALETPEALVQWIRLFKSKLTETSNSFEPSDPSDPSDPTDPFGSFDLSDPSDVNDTELYTYGSLIF